MSAELNTEQVKEGKRCAPRKKSSQQPVLVYIMILFIAAFLLMALSSLMQQRSNDEAFGKLEHSLSNMQTIQAHQEQIIDLQKQLKTAEEEQDALLTEIEALEAALAEEKGETAAEQLRAHAMLGLYNLQQNYLNLEYDACMEIINYMEENDLVGLLPTKAIDDATSPAVRYGQLKEALLAKTASK